MAEKKPVLYKVKDVIERMDMDSKGRFSRQVEVQAETANGIEFIVTMPKLQATPQAVEAALVKEATELEKIKGLAR